MGRKKLIDKGPRSIDLDILLYDQKVVSHERLNIPHNLMLERDFVLRPLSQYAPNASIPTPKQTNPPPQVDPQRVPATRWKRNQNIQRPSSRPHSTRPNTSINNPNLTKLPIPTRHRPKAQHTHNGNPKPNPGLLLRRRQTLPNRPHLHNRDSA
jgi:hypothetical protein